MQRLRRYRGLFVSVLDGTKFLLGLPFNLVLGTIVLLGVIVSWPFTWLRASVIAFANWLPAPPAPVEHPLLPPLETLEPNRLTRTSAVRRPFNRKPPARVRAPQCRHIPVLNRSTLGSHPALRRTPRF